jgi:cytochrome subunit of sulfide dehydrogenase
MRNCQEHISVMLSAARYFWVMLVVIGSLSFSNAADLTVQRGAALANACAACHGPEGRSTGMIPSLRNLSPNALHGALRAYRSGERTGTVMNRLTQGLDDADIDAITAHFAAKYRP